MPQTRPSDISDSVSLSDKEGREDRSLVPEEVAFDAGLPVAAVLREAPRERGVSGFGAKDDLISGSDHKVANPFGFSRTVVAAIEVTDAKVSVLGEPPERAIAKGPVSLPTSLLLGVGGGGRSGEGDGPKRPELGN